MMTRKWSFVAGLALFVALMLPLLVVYGEADVVVVEDTIFLGEIPGQTTAVDVAGGYAYVGFVDDFHVVDVRDVEKPVSVGNLLMSEEIRSIQVEGGLAYVNTTNSLVVVDVSLPEHPIARGSWTDAIVTDLVVVEPYAYLLNLTDLIVVDVADPDKVYDLGRLSLVPPDFFGFYDLAVSDDVAFAAKRAGTMDVIGTYLVDVANVADLELITQWEQYPWSISVLGDIAYTGSGGCSATICLAVLAAYDIGDLFNPQFLSSDETLGLRSDIELHGIFAYVTTNEALSAFHVGNPYEVQLWEIHLINPLGSSYSLRDSVVQGNYAYLANDDAFKIIQVHDFFYVHLPIARMAGPE